MEEIRNPRRSIALLVILAFLAGAGAGAIVASRVVQAGSSEPQPKHGPGRPGERKGHERAMDRMVRGLALDAETEKKVRAVFDARRGQFQAVFDKLRPEMDRLRKETRAEVRAVLPQEKQGDFDKLMAEEDAHEGKEHEGRH